MHNQLEEQSYSLHSITHLLTLAAFIDTLQDHTARITALEEPRIPHMLTSALAQERNFVQHD